MSSSTSARAADRPASLQATAVVLAALLGALEQYAAVVQTASVQPAGVDWMGRLDFDIQLHLFGGETAVDALWNLLDLGEQYVTSGALYHRRGAFRGALVDVFSAATRCPCGCLIHTEPPTTADPAPTGETL